MLALYAKVYGISNADAYREICEALQTGDYAPEYQSYQNRQPQEIAQSVSAAQEEVPDLHVLPPQQEEAAEELAEQPQAASYTADMDVSEITQRMTVDEAKAVVVQIGTCRGWTLEQVAQRRPASLKWYLYGCDQADNILKAAASVLLDNLQQKAG